MSRTEERKAYERAWHAANKDKVTAARKRWEAKNPGYWKERYVLEKVKHQARMREWYVANREVAKRRSRKNALMTRYGLTPEALALLMERHGNQCAICSGTRKLVIDHDHDSGEVRGILCDACNVGLGRFRDSAALLSKAAMYLVSRRSVREVS